MKNLKRRCNQKLIYLSVSAVVFVVALSFFLFRLLRMVKILVPNIVPSRINYPSVTRTSLTILRMYSKKIRNYGTKDRTRRRKKVKHRLRTEVQNRRYSNMIIIMLLAHYIVLVHLECR